MAAETPTVKIAVRKPTSEGAHAITTPVEEIVDGGPVPESRTVAVIGDSGAVLTAEQCFRLSDHFNKAGEALERYHDDHDSN